MAFETHMKVAAGTDAEIGAGQPASGRGGTALQQGHGTGGILPGGTANGKAADLQTECAGGRTGRKQMEAEG